MDPSTTNPAGPAIVPMPSTTARPLREFACSDIEALYRLSYGFYVSLASRVSGTRDHADEIVQEAFLKTLAARPSGLNDAELRGYVAAAVLNLCRSRSRRYAMISRRLGSRVLWDEEWAAARDLGPAEDDLVVADLALLDELRKLAKRQREVLILRFWVGLSLSECAVALGISVGSAKRHSTRAMAALKGRILEDDDARTDHEADRRNDNDTERR